MAWSSPDSEAAVCSDGPSFLLNRQFEEMTIENASNRQRVASGWRADAAGGDFISAG
jgi:hypothetical protein